MGDVCLRLGYRGDRTRETPLTFDLCPAFALHLPCLSTAFVADRQYTCLAAVRSCKRLRLATS